MAGKIDRGIAACTIDKDLLPIRHLQDFLGIGGQSFHAVKADDVGFHVEKVRRPDKQSTSALSFRPLWKVVSPVQHGILQRKLKGRSSVI